VATDAPQAAKLFEKGQRIVQSLEEKAGKKSGGGWRTITFEEMVSILGEISRSLAQNASAASSPVDLAGTLNGIPANRATGVSFSIQLAGTRGESLTLTSGEAAPSGDTSDSGSTPVAPSGVTENNSGSEPYILSFDATAGLYDTWILDGSVGYETPWTLTVVFGGVVSGSTGVDVDGSFSYSAILPADTSGIVSAQAHTTDGVGSNVAYDWITGGSSGSSGSA